MRYSKGAASLLSTVFAFRAKSVVFADIFSEEADAAFVPADVDADVVALTPTENVIDAGILSPPGATVTSSPPTIELKNKCKSGDSGCVHGRLRTPTNNDTADTGISNFGETAAKGTFATPGSDVTIASHHLPLLCDSYVNCINGFIADGTTSCFEACANGVDCCDGTDACDGFFGNVCRDGSCSGDEACRKANIRWVKKSCLGDSACYKAGYDIGSIGSIQYSCDGDFACEYLASNRGSIGIIKTSCNGNRACNWLGRYNGEVGNIMDSCRGTSACEDVATYSGGSIGHIKGSCVGSNACHGLGRNGGKVGDVTTSCTMTYSCYDGAAVSGVMGTIVNSCTGVNSCRYTGSEYGSIGNISNSCKAEEACEGAGYGLGGRITSNLGNCCNTASACADATQANLPATCKASASGPPPASKVREVLRICTKSSYQECHHCFVSSILFLNHSTLS